MGTTSVKEESMYILTEVSEDQEDLMTLKWLTWEDSNLKVITLYYDLKE